MTSQVIDTKPVDNSKRTWIIASSCAGIGAGTAGALTFGGSLMPSERAKAAGAAVEADISTLKPGEKMTVEWRGKPVWILKRTPEQMAALDKSRNELADPDSKRKTDELTPKYARNNFRAREDHKDILVVVGICSHLGCSPTDKLTPGPQPSLPDNWPGGFLCPCHGSTFDVAGRVFKNKPAPDNLEVPPYMYLSATKLLIGQDVATA
jgi:ubiquinol-cytochrome c reductase iron-sulfur subunit